MAKSSKLKNIEAINKMLRGEHRTQTRTSVGYENIDKKREDAKIRKVGEKWQETDIHGNVFLWEQMEGYRVRSRPNSEFFQEVRTELNSFKNCPKETCTCTNPTHIDKKFRRIHGMCLECVTAEETRMQISGKFDDYAKQKMYENVKAFFRERDKELAAMKAEVEKEIHFVTSDGEGEKWQFDNKEAALNRIESEYLKYKEQVLKLYDPDYVIGEET